MRGCRGKEICHLASATSAELVSGLKSRTALGAGANLCGSRLGLGFGFVGRLQRLFHSSGFRSSSGLGLGARGLFGGSGSLFLGNTSLLGLILGTGGLNCRVLLINRRVNGVYLGKLIGKTSSELGFTRGRVQCLAQLGIGGPNVSRKRAISSCAACTCTFSSSSVIMTPANLIWAKGIATIELPLLYTAPYKLYLAHLQKRRT